MVGDLITQYKDEIIHHLTNLINIPSVQSTPEEGKPFGKNSAAALQYIIDLSQSFGFKCENADGYACHIEYGEGNDIIGVLVHLDVVPAGDGWTYPAFGGEIHDGKMYGRGVDDDKGPAIVALYSLKALKDASIKLKKRIRIIFGVGEETGMDDMKYYFSKFPVPQMGFSPDCGYPVINAEKGILQLSLSSPIINPIIGRYELISANGGQAINIVPAKAKAVLKCLNKEATLEITTNGKAAHGAWPEEGINAVTQLFQHFKELFTEPKTDLEKFILFINEYIAGELDGKSLNIDSEDSISGKLTVNLGHFTYEDGTIKISLDIRHPVTENVQPIINTLKELATKNNLNFELDRYEKPNYIPAEHILIKTLSKAYEEITGQQCKLKSIGGGTYARTLMGNGVGFGGCGGKNFHDADEYITIDSMMEHARICTQAIYELGNKT